MEKMNKILILVLSSLLLQVYAQVKIIAIFPKGDAVRDVLVNVKEAVGEDIDVVEIEVEKDEQWENISQKALSAKPKAFLLLDNVSIRIYKEYFKEVVEGDPIPAVSLMAIQIERETSGLPILGISYEVPIVTSVVNLRIVSKKSISKVGVIYRDSWEPFIERNKEFCKSENVELVGYSIDDDTDGVLGQIKKGIKKLIKKKKVDAIIVLNDNFLLNKKSLTKAWMPKMKKLKIPVIVGVETLVNTNFKMGDFAVIPDNVGLGGQAGNLLFELMDNDWMLDEGRVDPSLSVMKILNRTLAEKKGFLNEEGLPYVDKEVE